MFVHDDFLQRIVSLEVEFHISHRAAYLVSEDSIGREICEVTAGVGGVTLHQTVAGTTPGLALGIPVNTTLELERKILNIVLLFLSPYLSKLYCIILFFSDKII